MPANEASRRRSQDAEPRAEEGSAARPLVREPGAEAAHSAAIEAHEQSAAADSAHASGDALEALERAAENIRPSWHGAELPPAPESSQASLPAALPPPPALPMFSSFPIEQPAPHYRVDTTVRTAAVLPERLAQLLRQPQIADASHWLRARPWALGSLAIAAVLLLAWIFWPSAPEAPKTADKPTPVSSAPAVPPAPAPSAAPEPPVPAAPSEIVAKQPDSAPPALSVKKRDKRKAAAGKPAAVKADVKPAAVKARKPAKAAPSPAH